MKTNKNKEKTICPFCNSKNTVKKGIRKNKLQEIQKFKCKECSKFFSKKELIYKTYPAKIILNAISTYNLGYSLDKTSKLINSKFKTSITPATIHSWLKEFKNICTYSKLRKNSLKYNKPKDIIATKTFRHNEQPYKYQYHNSKITFLKQFPALKQYLKRIKDSCPNRLFSNKNKRCSELTLNISPKLKRKQNYATKLAELALKITSSSRERHQILQDFMLINDSATIAAEIPVFMKFKNSMLTGHIDILQIRFNKLHVIDYKPEAEKEKQAISQVCLYTLALSKLTGIPLNQFVCAYFNEKSYFEFHPTPVF